MEKLELKNEYETRFRLYDRLYKNLRDAIQIFLEEKQISFLTITGRVKKFESFFEKVTSKGYTHPFVENTDFVGVRILLYYPQDIEQVAKVIQEEFDVIEHEDKAERLDVNEFGYRSYHFLVKIRNAWASTPNYRGLNNIPAEIQVRTILMHAWAEIEHKLQYKSKQQVPKALQRKLFLLSAKFEEADLQLQELKTDIGRYRQQVAEKVASTGDFDTTIELNLDTFKELLFFFYPNNYPRDNMAQTLLGEIEAAKLTLKEIVNVIKKFKPYEADLQSKVSAKLAAPAVLEYALEIFQDGFWHADRNSKSRNRIITELRDRAR